jgi:hypothetical protein
MSTERRRGMSHTTRYGARMSRIMQRLDDYRPLAAQVKAAEPGDEILCRYHGTELVQCWGDDQRCTRAVIATGPLDVGLTLELVDEEGWVFVNGRHYCPQHRAQALGQAVRESGLMDPGDLTLGQRAMADQNWATCNDILTGLIADFRAHRATHCQDWTCPGEAGNLVAAMTNGQIHMVARAAVERLAALLGAR